MVIDEDERSQAREVARVRDHLTPVRVGLVEAVIPDLAVVEAQVDREGMGVARAVATTTASRNSCSP